MTNLYSRKSKFHDVVKDQEAVMFHAVKYQAGNRYPLAVQCFQYIQHKNRMK